MEKTINNDQLWESSGTLKRYKYNPVLEAINEHDWESKMVYNCGVIKIKGVIYLIYRAFGNDHISRFGLAWTEDSVKIQGRLDFPIFDATEDYEYPLKEYYEKREREKGGCEDPRITIINNRLYMVYTAYSELCQTAIAFINVNEFIELVKKSVNDSGFSKEKLRKKWNNTWKRYGPVFPENIKNKIFSRNGCVFPVEIEGNTVGYSLIYRTSKDPVMIAYSKSPVGSWKDDEVFMTPTQYWEMERMGICAPPIKTTHGLLFFYHGVESVKNNGRIYRMGHLFTNFSLDSSGKIKVKVTKAEKPDLAPQRIYERESKWLAPCNTFAVFSCGAVPVEEKEALEENDNILVYYAGGDTRICVAKARISTLLS
ncbi:MAG: hypothetical protein KAT54_06340 [Candidatus Marinimicrobia bacterium]|nr:hypothetical protein [Candidatus Neomarinimicrobiota bacterium]